MLRGKDDPSTAGKNGRPAAAYSVSFGWEGTQKEHDGRVVEW